MAVTRELRAVVESLDADLPIYEVLSRERAIAKETWFYWIFGGLFMVIGLIALFLAIIGLTGVMSFTVSRRTQGMEIRVALGADSSRLIRLVMRRGSIRYRH